MTLLKTLYNKLTFMKFRETLTSKMTSRQNVNNSIIMFSNLNVKNINARPLRSLHRQQTMNDDLRVLKVNKHIHECSDDFKIVPLYKVLNNNASLRDEKERYLINILKPELFVGLC